MLLLIVALSPTKSEDPHSLFHGPTLGDIQWLLWDFTCCASQVYFGFLWCKTLTHWFQFCPLPDMQPQRGRRVAAIPSRMACSLSCFQFLSALKKGNESLFRSNQRCPTDSSDSWVRLLKSCLAGFHLKFRTLDWITFDSFPSLQSYSTFQCCLRFYTGGCIPPLLYTTTSTGALMPPPL